MTDRPIIFSGLMVRALLEGRKTQTRRLATSPLRKCEPGDRLWVRETCWIAPPFWTDTPVNPCGPHRQEVAYKADDRRGYTAEAATDYKLKLRPSIHMPRWASRLTLIVEAVWVETLQAISSEDAIAEGVLETEFYDRAEHKVAAGAPWSPEKLAYADLWQSLHAGNGFGWEDNPDVLVLTFHVHHSNIDRIAA